MTEELIARLLSSGIGVAIIGAGFMLLSRAVKDKSEDSSLLMAITAVCAIVGGFIIAVMPFAPLL